MQKLVRLWTKTNNGDWNHLEKNSRRHYWWSIDCVYKQNNFWWNFFFENKLLFYVSWLNTRHVDFWIERLVDSHLDNTRPIVMKRNYILFSTNQASLWKLNLLRNRQTKQHELLQPSSILLALQFCFRGFGLFSSFLFLSWRASISHWKEHLTCKK